MDYFAALARAFLDLLIDVPNTLASTTVGEGRAIVVTYSIAIVTALMAYVVSRRRDAATMRHEHSANFYAGENLTGADLGELTHRFSDNYVALVDLTSEERKTHKDTIDRVVNHYERVAIGIAEGYLSERFVRATERFKMITTFMSLSPSVNDARYRWSNPTALEYFECLFYRMFFPEYRWILLPLEIFSGRPHFFVTRAVFMMEYHSARVAFPTVQVLLSVFGIREEYPFFEDPLDTNWVKVKRAMGVCRRTVLAVVLILLAPTYIGAMY